jgi:hypothetical protein
MINKFSFLSVIQTLYAQGARIIKGEKFSRENHNAIQFHSGNEDFNPANGTEMLCAAINNNNASTAVLVYKDKIQRISNQGEKRIYSTDEDGAEVVAEIHLKNDGKLYIEATDELDLVVGGNCNITISGNAVLGITGNATVEVGGDASLDVTGACDITAGTEANIDAPAINLGTGGAYIARLGDQVTVGGITGTITSASLLHKCG